MKKQPIYKQLAKNIIEKISSGVVSHGDKLPSLRVFSVQQQVSVNTAIRCYEYLVDLGYVESEAKSGFLIRKPQHKAQLNEFPQFKGEIKEVNKKLYSNNQNRSSFTPLLTAQVSPEFVPINLLKSAFNKGFQTQNIDQFIYSSAQGNQALINALIEHFSYKGFALKQQELLITHGCIDAVATALNVVSKPGDTIAVNSPCFNGILELLALYDRKVIEIPSTNSGLDLNQLSRIVEKHTIAACLFSSNFQNPTGHSLSAEQKQWLANFAAQHKLPIIEDDVFIELHHQGVMPLPIKHWDKEGWVLWCSSVSKSLAAGLRLGWCAAGRFSETFNYHNKVKNLGVNQPIQKGVAEFINRGHYARHIKKINQTLLVQIASYRRFLYAILPKNTVISDPKGGVVLWVKVPNIDTRLLEKHCLDEGIYIRSGYLFSTQKFYSDCFRINVGWPLTEQIKNQLKVLAQFLKTE
ncbi:PLP-dependent aminotransferase family protein [Colwellia sp. RE-S-Sl-9]